MCSIFFFQPKLNRLNIHLDNYGFKSEMRPKTFYVRMLNLVMCAKKVLESTDAARYVIIMSDAMENSVK